MGISEDVLTRMNQQLAAMDNDGPINLYWVLVKLYDGTLQYTYVAKIQATPTQAAAAARMFAIEYSGDVIVVPIAAAIMASYEEIKAGTLDQLVSKGDVNGETV